MNLELAAYLDALSAAKDADLVAAVASGSDGDRRRVRVFAMAGGKPRLLKELQVPEAEITEVKERMGESGVPIGTFHSRHLGWTWSASPDRFRLWSSDGLALDARRSEVELADGSRIPTGEIEGVEPYVAPDWLERGVRLLGRGAAPLTIASHASVIARADPTFDDERLDFETAWARLLARALADWLRVRYVEPQWADTPSFD